MAAGVVKGEGFAVDPSIIAADASGPRGIPKGEDIADEPGAQRPCGSRVSGSIG
jgi:hypothetical protein